MKRSREADKRRGRLLEICGALPEIDAAVYLRNHHGDGRIALCCKADSGEQGRLVQEDPRRFPSVAWGEIAYLLGMAYRLTAPRTLVARLEQR